MPIKDLDFRRETGRLALDWIITLGERHGNSIERLSCPDDLERWLRIVAGQKTARDPTEYDLGEAKRLRASIIGIVEALHSSKPPVDHDIETINEFAAIPPHPMRLAASGTKVEQDSLPSPSCVFGNIARDAVDLVTGKDFAKMKLCEADDCSVYFVDHSRPGKRRWCSMSRCGNKAKKNRYNARKA